MDISIRRRLLGSSSQAIDINSRPTIAAAMLMAVIGPEVFIVQPGFVQGLVELLGFTDSEAGYVASSEMWGLAVTAVAMTFLSSRINWRVTFAVSLALVITGNLLSTLVHDPVSFAIVRLVTGLGSGGVVTLSFAVIGLTASPDRNFGWLIMWVLTYGAIALFVMPTAYAVVGFSGILVFFAGFAAVGLLFIRFLPNSGEEHVQVEAGAIDLGTSHRAMALAAMICYFLAQGAVWAYLFRNGIAGGSSEQQVANGLTISQFFGIGGALTAVMVGARYGRIAPLTLGILAGLVPLMALYGVSSALVFAAAVCVYNYAWQGTHPYLLAAMASFDHQAVSLSTPLPCKCSAWQSAPHLVPCSSPKVVTAVSYLSPQDYSC